MNLDLLYRTVFQGQRVSGVGVMGNPSHFSDSRALLLCETKPASVIRGTFSMPAGPSSASLRAPPEGSFPTGKCGSGTRNDQIENERTRAQEETWENEHVYPPISFGPLTLDPPVVLAPMAGVTNAPFRTLCRRFGAGLYVSEMVMARAVVERNKKTERMISFAPGESPRSIQLYGTEPRSLGEAVRRLVAEGLVDHIDMNFGCPAPKVTRNGGGSAVPLKRNLFRSIVRAAVVAAREESGGRVPVTIKFRKGLNDDLLTFLDAGRIGEEEGVAGVALHARTAEQLYSGKADWKAVGELKEAVTSIPVLGNGDIWEASDALTMMHETGCDGVVVGRGCLGKPWLFRDLADAFAGRPIQEPPVMEEVTAMMREHAQLLWNYFELDRGIRDFRKHAGWYVTGYSVGPDMRRRLGQVSSLDELDDLIGEIDPTLRLPEANRRIPRGHTNGPRPVHLPHGYLDNLDDSTPPSVEEESMANGG